MGRSPGVPRGGILAFSGERHCLGDPDGPAAPVGLGSAGGPVPLRDFPERPLPRLWKKRLCLASVHRGGSSQGPARLEGASS